MIKIYHNPRCAKSRAGLNYLTGKNIPFEVVLYLKNYLTAKDLKMLLMKLNIAPSDLVRTNEDLYKKELKGKKFTDEEWIDILAQNPRLIQRPVIEGKYRAVIAIPAEEMDKVLSE